MTLGKIPFLITSGKAVPDASVNVVSAFSAYLYPMIGAPFAAGATKLTVRTPRVIVKPVIRTIAGGK
jgi:hypothetical protein